MIKKIKDILQAARKAAKPSKDISPVMAKRLEESMEQARSGKVVKITLDEIWK